MATALVKGKLKAAREAIAAKDWSKAEQNARSVSSILTTMIVYIYVASI